MINKKFRGLTLIEAGLWVMLLSLSLVAGAKLLRDNRQSDLYSAEAQYMQKMQQLAQSYMNQHRDDIEHMRSSTGGDQTLICNSALNLCNIDPALVMVKVDIATGDLGIGTTNRVKDAFDDGTGAPTGAYIRILRRGVAPNYTFDGLIVTNHSITHTDATTPANDMLGKIVDILGINGGVTNADGKTYGYQGAWSTPMTLWKYNTCDGCLAYRFGDWAGNASNALYLPVSGAKAMQGAMSLAGFDINNVNNVIADTSIEGQPQGVTSSFATITGTTDARRIDVMETADGKSPLGIQIGANMQINTMHSIPYAGYGILTADSVKGIDFYATSYYTNTLSTRDSGLYYGTRNLNTDMTFINALNIMGNTNVDTSRFKNFTLANFDNYNKLIVQASNTGGPFAGSLLQTSQLNVDGDSTLNVLDSKLNPAVPYPNTSNALIVKNFHVPSDGNNLSTADHIITPKLEAYNLGSNLATGNFNSPVYANMVLMASANTPTAVKLPGVADNINTQLSTYSGYFSSTGVVTATCPAAQPVLASASGATCTDPNDWANGAKSQLQSSYPAGIQGWQVVCTYPGPNPPAPIVASVTINCYKPG